MFLPQRNEGLYIVDNFLKFNSMVKLELSAPTKTCRFDVNKSLDLQRLGVI